MLVLRPWSGRGDLRPRTKDDGLAARRLFDWGVPLLYGGLVRAAAGVVPVAKPLRVLAIRSRRAGFASALTGAVLAVAGILLPVPLRTSRGERSRLDDVLPSFQF